MSASYLRFFPTGNTGTQLTPGSSVNLYFSGNGGLDWNMVRHSYNLHGRGVTIEQMRGPGSCIFFIVLNFACLSKKKALQQSNVQLPPEYRDQEPRRCLALLFLCPDADRPPILCVWRSRWCSGGCSTVCSSWYILVRNCVLREEEPHTKSDKYSYTNDFVNFVNCALLWKLVIPKGFSYCIPGNFRQEFNFVAFVKAIFWLN